MYIWLVIFVGVPLIELWLILTIGEYLGISVTIVIIIGTGVLGFTLVKISGLSILLKIRQKMENGKMPGDEIIEGVLILIAGALLLTPGFLTDTFGFLMLFPPTRKLARKYITTRMSNKIQFRNYNIVDKDDADEF